MTEYLKDGDQVDRQYLEYTRNSTTFCNSAPANINVDDDSSALKDVPSLSDIIDCQCACDGEINLTTFTTYLTSIHCQENLEFIIDVKNYKNQLGQEPSSALSSPVMDLWHHIYSKYLTQDSEDEINLPGSLTLQLHYAQPPSSDILEKCSLYITNEILQNLYHEFVKKLTNNKQGLYRRKSALVPPTIGTCGLSSPSPRNQASSCCSHSSWCCRKQSQLQSELCKTQHDIAAHQQMSKNKKPMAGFRPMTLTPPLSPPPIQELQHQKPHQHQHQHHHNSNLLHKVHKQQHGDHFRYSGYDYYSIPQSEEDKSGSSSCSSNSCFKNTSAEDVSTDQDSINNENDRVEALNDLVMVNSYSSNTSPPTTSRTDSMSTNNTSTSMSRGGSLKSTLMDNSVQYFNNKMKKLKFRRFSQEDTTTS
ncbi:uncharacterized protein LODBEIA_P16150 [Lodderomyces beijingensis]|uniref:RGS domain-containing protein n=1 Tax=Lodderomyces beijingensis TaxID=1775926 RepID=A0ABP0ZGU2_9ASCO